MPIGLLVTVVIRAEQLDDFLKVIETDAVESRKEPGCSKFI